MLLFFATRKATHPTKESLKTQPARFSDLFYDEWKLFTRDESTFAGLHCSGGVKKAFLVEIQGKLKDPHPVLSRSQIQSVLFSDSILLPNSRANCKKIRIIIEILRGKLQRVTQTCQLLINKALEKFLINYNFFISIIKQFNNRNEVAARERYQDA